MTDAPTMKLAASKGSGSLVILAVLIAAIWSCSKLPGTFAGASAATDQAERLAIILGSALGSGAVVAFVVVLALYVLCAIFKRNIGWAAAIFVALAATVPAIAVPATADMIAAPARAEARAALQAFEAANAKEQAQYAKALNLDDLTHCLAPDVLKLGLDMTACLERVQAFRDGGVGLLLLAQAGPTDLEKHLAVSELSPANQRRVLADFSRKYARLEPTFEKVAALRGQVADQVEAILVDLDKARGAWRVQSQNVAFDRQSDLDAYGAGMARLRTGLSDLNFTISSLGRVESPVIRPQAEQPIEAMRPR